MVFKPKQITAPISQTTINSNLGGTDYQPQVNKNYTGNDFTVEYPASRAVEDNATYSATLGASAINFINGDPNDTASNYETEYIVFLKGDITTDEALSKYTKNLIKHVNGNQSFPITEKSVTVAGEKGFQYSYKAIAGGYDGTVYVTAIVHNQTAYIIQFVNGTQADYEKFVSSFTFLE
jgi:hypothetical protein